MRTHLMVMVSLLGSLAVAEAGPKPTLAEVKTYVIDAKGNMVPYTQDFVGTDVLLAVKITGGEPYQSASLTFTGTEDHSAAYSEAGKKVPPKKKHKLTRKLALQPGDATWVQMTIERTCYDGQPQLTLGTSKLAVELPGSCAI